MIYNDCLDETRKSIGKDYIWVSLDSTSDSKLRNVVGFIIGSLSHPEKGPFLVNLEELPNSEHSTYVDFFKRSLSRFFNDGLHSFSLIFLGCLVFGTIFNWL